MHEKKPLPLVAWHKKIHVLTVHKKKPLCPESQDSGCSCRPPQQGHFLVTGLDVQQQFLSSIRWILVVVGRFGCAAAILIH